MQNFDYGTSTPVTTVGAVLEKGGTQPVGTAASASASASASAAAPKAGQNSPAASGAASTSDASSRLEGCTDVAPQGSTCAQQKVRVAREGRCAR